MRSILYVIAVILVISWIFGFFYASVGGIIHLLLVLAVISIIIGAVRKS